MCVARHFQIPQINKFAISFQYLTKEVSDEVYFLHPVAHESFLQIDTVVLIGMVKHSQVFQNSKFAIISERYLEKEVTDEVDFFNQSWFQFFGRQSVYKVIVSLLMGISKHFQSTQSKRFAIFLQYLKKLG